jgi:CRISPR-associated protein Cas1
MAERFGIPWSGRRYDPSEWKSADHINRSISSANACLYAVTEAAILVAGYSPAVGFLHSGKPLSFVYDIADLYKFDVSLPVAFQVVAEKEVDVEGSVRRRLRDKFSEARLMERIISDIEEVLDVGD